MARSQRTAQPSVRVNEADFGSGEGEAAAVDAWEAQLAFDDGEELEPQQQPNGDNSAPEDDADEEDNWSADEEDDEPEDDADEDAGDKDDEDEEDADEEDEDEDPGSTSPINPDTKVKVRVDGQETEVTFRELQDGYSRTQDYTQKTQALAAQRKELEAAQQQAQQVKQEWGTYLEQMETAITAVLGGRSDAEWAALEQQDRYTYLEERAKERALQDRLQAVKAEKQRTQQEQQHQQQEQWNQVIKRETDALLNALPSWKDDPNVAARDRGKMLQYAKTLGFSEQEVNGLVDHRVILVLRDAARLHALSAKKGKTGEASKVRKRATGSLKAGKPTQGSAGNSKLRKSAQRLAKSHTVEAAADYFDQYLDD